MQYAVTMKLAHRPVVQLTDDEETSSCPRESDVDLVAVRDEAQVLTSPTVRRVTFYFVAGQRPHGAEDHIIPLSPCKNKK